MEGIEDVEEPEDEVWLVLDVDDEAVEIVAGSALADETAGPIVKPLLGSWQHSPVCKVLQQNGVVEELQGRTSGYISRDTIR